MVGSTYAEMEPSQILSEAGIERFRTVVQSGIPLRCTHLWMVTSTAYNDAGQIEIEILCGLNRLTDRWEVEVYYNSLDRAISALCEYERTGNMPEGE